MARTAASASCPVTRTVGMSARIARASEEPISPRPMMVTRAKGSMASGGLRHGAQPGSDRAGLFLGADGDAKAIGQALTG